LKRVLKYLFLLAVGGLPAILLGTAGWLFCTEAGGKMLVETVSRFTKWNIQAETIEGNLSDALRLTNMVMKGPQGSVRIRQLQLSMRPLDLLAGHLGISALSADHVSVLDDSPQRQPELVWPRAKGWITLASGSIGRLTVRDLTYLRTDEQPVRIAALAASAAWKNSQLSVNDLRLNLSSFTLEGSVLAGFQRPLLKARLAATPAHPTAGVDSIRMDGDFGPGKKPGEVSGSLQIQGLQNTRPVLRMSSNIGMTPAGVTFAKILLRRENRPGSIAGEGFLTFKGPTPYVTLKAQAENVDFSDELKIPAKLNGSLLFDGTGRQYQGRIVLSNTADARHAFRLASDYSGDSEGVALSAIRGTALGGSLNGSLEIQWTDGLRMSGAISGRDLDPARWDSDWTGVVHFDLEGDASVPDGGPASGAFLLTLKESRLHGRQLTGALQASFAGENLDIQRLALRGKGFEISAGGSVANRLNFSAEIGDLSKLISCASGSLAARGWTRLRHEQFSGAVSARGRDLAVNGWSVASANFNASVEDRAQSPFSLDADFSRLRHPNLTADALTVRGGGTVLSHTLRASMRRGPYKIILDLSGAWRKKGWLGKMVRLEGTDEVGPWKLSAPAALSVSPEHLSLGPMEITGRGPETLRLSADLSGYPPAGPVDLSWSQIDLARINAWTDRDFLTGSCSGTIRAKLLPDRRFALLGEARLDQSKIHQRGRKGDIRIDLRRASFNWDWQKDTLACDVAVVMADHGELKGKIRLPMTARFPVSLNEQGPLQGSLAGQLQEKGALGVLFPGLVQESRGNLDLDIQMSGSPASPLFEGRILLSEAGGYLPSAGITLQDVRIDARPAKDGVIIDSFRAVSGPGYLDGSARIHLKGLRIANVEGHLNGERFQAIHFPELHVQATPRLTFSGTPEKISVRGEVLLPLFQVNGTQSKGAVESSSDVVREGKAGPSTRKPSLGLDVQVKVVLGEQAQFNASGIDAKLGGQMEIGFTDPERISGRGEIRVMKGRFRTYGVNLEIVRGHLFYAGGPVNQPALDILALRKIGDVKAGVAVTGTLPNPVIKLYSDPYMQDMDILAYIVLGHLLGSDTWQAGLLATAAGAVLTSRQAEDLLEQIQGYLGLASLEISSDVLEKNNRMGYKRLKVTPEGTGGSSQSASETILVVGKYLTPELYISYGRSLFSGGNLFFLRYDISKKWQVESQMGQESGIDLYYKLQFH